MTSELKEKVYNLGAEAYRKGDKRVPSYEISILWFSNKDNGDGSAKVWLQGWDSEHNKHVRVIDGNEE